MYKRSISQLLPLSLVRGRVRLHQAHALHDSHNSTACNKQQGLAKEMALGTQGDSHLAKSIKDVLGAHPLLNGKLLKLFVNFFILLKICKLISMFIHNAML